MENKVKEKKGLLIDYHYCTGCHSCEVAYQQKHGFLKDSAFGATNAV
jgi:Fe-S-cluster-containing dehydrogenase component